MKKLALTLLGLSSSAFAADEVSLLSAMNVPMSKYGMHWQSPQVRLRVKNLAYDKSVRVVYTDSEGQSSVAVASYVGPADDGYEIWESFGNVRGSEGARFRVEYAAVGETFAIEEQDLKYGPVFYAEQKVQQVLSAKQFYGNSANFVVAVRNLAYHKNVEAHYSCDDFRSESTVGLWFQSYFMYGYGSVNSPTADGYEMWSANYVQVPPSCSTLRFYYTYDANGQHFADTNFGHNYVMYRN